MIPGRFRYETGIEVHEEVVLMTTNGEAIALGIAQTSAVELSSCDHGVVVVVAKAKRCIMERDMAAFVISGLLISQLIQTWIRFHGGIAPESLEDMVFLMTTNGEAIALGIAQMSTVELLSYDHGVVAAKVKRCIMERDLYPRGPTEDLAL
ncbi:MAG: hypothetical protein Q9222_002196 [Ikaeria aurantiellina]